MKTFLIKLLTLILVVSTALCIGTACKQEGGDSNATHVHEFSKTVISPTCTEQGYTICKCSCGEEFKDNYVNPLGHDFKNYVSDNNATTEADGTKMAICERNGCNETDTVTDVGSKLESVGLTFKTLTVNETTVSGKVGYTVTKFDFNNELTVSTGYKFVVALSENGTNQVLTKTLDLVVGDNVCYVFLMNGDEVIKIYTVTIRRLAVYTVSFNTGVDSVTIPSQTIEEGGLALKPNDLVVDGYDFLGYDFDFNTPIASNVEIVAQLEAIFKLNGGTITNLTTYGETLTKIVIPKSINGVDITNISNSALEGRYLTSIEVDSNNIAYKSIDGVLYSKNGKTLIRYPIAKIGVPFVIPNGVESIGNNSFQACDYLISIEIPNIVGIPFWGSQRLVEVINKSPYITVAKGSDENGCVGLYALSVSNRENSYSSKVSADSNGYVTYNDGTDIILVNYVGTQSKLTLPSNITKINNDALSYLDVITSVVIPNSVESIGRAAFNYCTNLTSVTIGNAVKSIGDYAFQGCSKLTSIEIPNSVTSIGKYAFRYCSSLTSITFSDTSTWYITTNSSDFENKTNGTEVDVTNATNNARYFESTYYWYKK